MTESRRTLTVVLRDWEGSYDGPARLMVRVDPESDTELRQLDTGCFVAGFAVKDFDLGVATVRLPPGRCYLATIFAGRQTKQRYITRTGTYYDTYSKPKRRRYQRRFVMPDRDYQLRP